MVDKFTEGRQKIHDQKQRHSQFRHFDRTTIVQHIDIGNVNRIAVMLVRHRFRGRRCCRGFGRRGVLMFVQMMPRKGMQMNMSLLVM